MCTGVNLRRVSFYDSSSPCYTTLVPQFRILNQCLRGVYVCFLPTRMYVSKEEKSRCRTIQALLSAINQEGRIQCPRNNRVVRLGASWVVPQGAADFRYLARTSEPMIQFRMWCFIVVVYSQRRTSEGSHDSKEY